MKTHVYANAAGPLCPPDEFQQEMRCQLTLNIYSVIALKGKKSQNSNKKSQELFVRVFLPPRLYQASIIQSAAVGCS